MLKIYIFLFIKNVYKTINYHSIILLVNSITLSNKLLKKK
jgi:hypothetical protein